MENAGFKIGDQTYGFPERFRIGDGVLVKELTGIEFEEFAERLDRMNDLIDEGREAPNDSLVMVALIGVSVWQANPRWTRAKARQFVERLDMDEIDLIEPEEDTEVPLEPSGNDSDEQSSDSIADPAASEEARV